MLKEQYATMTQAAEMLNVNRITIRRWFQSGKLDGERIGRVLLIRRDSLQTMVQEKDNKLA